METTILKDGYIYAVIYTKDRLPVKNDFYQTSEGSLSFDSKRNLWFKGGTHQDHLMAIAYVEYWLEEQTPLPHGLPNDEAIEDESGNWCLDSKEPFIGGAKWMRSLAHRKLEYWKEVALNPDCICDRTVEIDKCPVHSTGPDC